jgi:hypothetical protein
VRLPGGATRGTRTWRPGAALLGILLVTLSLPILPADVAELAGLGRARAAEYRMWTQARYDVQPSRGAVEVRVEVRFRNTTPNPPGHFSVFEVVDLAVQPGARKITARDGRGALDVSPDAKRSFTRVTVRLRRPVRYRDEARFTLSYRIVDGDSRQIRIQRSLVILPAWSFGTEGHVRIGLPDGFEVRIAGKRMRAETGAERVTLISGRIRHPDGWLSQITASRPSSYTTTRRSVPLAGGAIQLRLLAWADDLAWRRRVVDLLTRGLPRLEAQIGVEQVAVSALDVVESVPPIGAPALAEPEAPITSRAGTSELRLAFDAGRFEILHQAAHLWLSDRLVADRWISEGFASRAAGRVARSLQLDLPYDPARRTAELADDAFPLVSWGAGPASRAQEAYAYAASWHVADRLADAVGPDLLRLAWRRLASGIPAYEPAETTPSRSSEFQPPPVDSRMLLDQLEELSEAPVEALFRERVFDESTAGMLSHRREARERYADLLDKAGTWGAPRPVRSDMAAWRFGLAVDRIEAAASWLDRRDRLVKEISAAGLTVPRRLEDAYVTAGGEAGADDELQTEAGIVASYREALGEAGRPRGVLERLGLLGATDPSDMLAEANVAFGEGDLPLAAQEIDAAGTSLDAAAANGIVRIGSLVALVVGLLVLAFFLARHRRGTDYTARP